VCPWSSLSAFFFRRIIFLVKEFLINAEKKHVGINDNIQPRNLLVADALIFLLNAATSSSVSLLFDASFSATLPLV
jgi:hypothetical protein